MKTFMMRILTMVTAMLLAACGPGAGGGSDTGSTSGTGGGSTPTTTGSGTAAISFTLDPASCTSDGRTISLAGVSIVVRDRTVPDACGLADVCTQFKNTTTTTLYVASYDTKGGTAGAIEPGTYAIGGQLSLTAGTVASGLVAVSDGNCANKARSATGGTVTLDAISGTDVKGSYRLTFSNGQPSVSGSFSAEVCARLPVTADACNLEWSWSGCSGTVACR